MKKICFTAFLVLASQGFCILSPLNQSIREMNAVLDSFELRKLNQSEEIQEIVRSDSGFVVLTNDSVINVSIVYNPSTLIGPRQFSLQFEEPVSRDH